MEISCEVKHRFLTNFCVVNGGFMISGTLQVFDEMELAKNEKKSETDVRETDGENAVPDEVKSLAQIGKTLSSPNKTQPASVRVHLSLPLVITSWCLTPGYLTTIFFVLVLFSTIANFELDVLGGHSMSRFCNYYVHVSMTDAEYVHHCSRQVGSCPTRA